MGGRLTLEYFYLFLRAGSQYSAVPGPLP